MTFVVLHTSYHLASKKVHGHTLLRLDGVRGNLPKNGNHCLKLDIIMANAWAHILTCLDLRGGLKCYFDVKDFPGTDCPELLWVIIFYGFSIQDSNGFYDLIF